MLAGTTAVLSGSFLQNPRSRGDQPRGSAARRVPLRLGLVTYNWGKDWTLADIIQNCEAAGFSGVELRSTHRHGVEITLSRSQREEVRSRFADSPVELAGLGSACEYHSPDPAERQRQIDRTRAFLQLSHDVGGSGVKVRPNAIPDGVPPERTIEQIGRALNTVGRMAADLNQQIRVEVHGRKTSEIPVMKAIMDFADHPSVGVCWNCNPADLHGKGFRHNFDQLKDRLATVHIHDLRQNRYPWAELFQALQTVETPSFTGWTLLEDGHVPQDILSAMKQNRDLWNTLAGAS